MSVVQTEPGRSRRSSGPHPELSVAAAARRLGVAPATLRTWDRRYGIGPSEHTPGRHRRYSSDDIARLDLMQHALVRGASPADAARFATTTRCRPGRPAGRAGAGAGAGQPAGRARPAGPEAAAGRRCRCPAPAVARTGWPGPP